MLDKNKSNGLLFVSSPVECNMMTIYKDTCLAYYFSKLYNYNVIVDDWYDLDYPNLTQFRTMDLQKYKHRNFLLKFAKTWKIFRQARMISILYTFQIGFDSGLKMLAYRLGGGKGQIYLKLDLSMDGYRSKNGKDLLVWENMPIYLKFAHKIFKPLADLISVETHPVYERLKGTYYGDLIDKDKLIVVSNGVDPEILKESGINRKPVCQKDKIIITVGRLGTYQKNTELLLDILLHINFKGWKMYLIGPIEPSFERTISDFYNTHPLMRDKIIFLGKISHKELYEYYNNARVFILTSRGESFAFVLAEAAYMHNYIISSNVGVASDLHAAGIPSSILETMDSDGFSRELQKIIDLSDDELNKIYDGIDTDSLTWEEIIPSSTLGSKLVHPTRSN